MGVGWGMIRDDSFSRLVNNRDRRRDESRLKKIKRNIEEKKQMDN
jgi:hypothetical protein